MAAAPPSPSSRLLAVLLVITGQCTVGAATVCDSFGARYRTEIQELLDDVFASRKLNLVILLDVSGSIGYDVYRREVETFAVDLIEYGIRKSGLVVHPDFARLHLLTFGDLAKIQVYPYRPIHACEVFDELQRIKPGSFDGRTEVHVAFNTTRRLFINTQRPGDRKVLFLVTDGGFTSPPAAIRTSVGQLRALGVEIFTVGVGSLSSSWVQRNIDRVVLDDLHILCYDSWSELMKWARLKEVKVITWANVTASQLENSCPACMVHSKCMCAVNIQRYICRCDPGRYLNKQGSCEVCPGSCPDENSGCSAGCDENKTKDESDPIGSHLVLIISTLTAALAVILLVACLLITLCRWRRHRRRRTPNAAPGVSAIFNFLFFRVDHKSVVVNEKDASSKTAEPNVYVISADGADAGRAPYTLDAEVQTPVSVTTQVEEAFEDGQLSVQSIRRQTGRRTRATEESYASASQRHSTDSSHRYLSIEPQPDRLDDDGYLIPLSRDRSAGSSREELYKDVFSLADGYTSELKRLVDDTDLEGVALFCKEDNSLVTGGDFRVRLCDIGHMLQLLQSDGQQGMVLPVNGRMHQVKVHHQGSSLYAEEMPGSKDKGAVWAINTEKHLVMGAGIRAMALTCEQTISTFAAKLAT